MDHLTSFTAIILDTAAKATVMLALAWASIPLLKKSSAATRYLLRSLVVGALLLLPFSGLLPAWRVNGIPEFAPATVISGAPTASTAVVEPALSTAPRTKTLEAPKDARVSRTHEISDDRRGAHRNDPSARIAQTRARTAPPIKQSTAEAAPPKVSYDIGLAKPDSQLGNTNLKWLPVVSLVWLAGAIFFISRWAMSVRRLRLL